MQDDIKPPKTRAKTSRPVVDWERVEADYRAGVKTLREIAGEYGISHTAIGNHIRDEGWTRDLMVKITAKSESIVSNALVSSIVSSKSPETKAAEKLVIEANAEAIATVKLSHRSDLRRQRAVVNNLLSELELTTGPENAATLAELGELMRSPDNNGRDRLNDVYQQLISLPERVKSSKDLTDQLTRLVEAERRAWNIPDPDKIKPGEGDVASGQPQRAMSDVERAVRLAAMLTKARAAGGDDKGTAA